MKSFLQAFRLTFLRFRWEILAFWIFSVALVTIVASHSPTLDPQRFRQPLTQPDYAKLEILAACWLMLRLSLSEPVFLTQGGWRTRPVTRAAARYASSAVLAVALLPSLLARLIAITTLTKPDARIWGDLFVNNLLWGVLVIALSAIVIRLAGGLLWGKQPGPARRAACGIFAVLAVTAWLHPATSRVLQPGHGGISWSPGGSFNYDQLVPGLRLKLPTGAKLHGNGRVDMWEGTEVPYMRELFQVSAVPGAVVRGNGMSLEILRVEPNGNAVEIDAEITVADSNYRFPRTPTMLLHFPGSDYSFRQQGSTGRTTYPLYAFPVSKLRCGGSFVAPTENPDWNQLLPQLQLLAFTPDYSQPHFSYVPTEDDRKKAEGPDTRRKPLPPLPLGLAGEVTDVFNGLDYDPEWDKRDLMKAKGETIAREGMPHVMARHPWSDRSWELFVKPFLLKHAAESDKPVLLERMTTEPRLGEIFIAKGWKTDAMPLLKRFAKDRLPLDAVSLGALLEEKDPSQAADLAALAIRLPGDLAPLEPLLRGHPGLDWPAFVRQGWRLRKYAYRMDLVTPPFDLWAAQEGDPTGFQFVAEKAARRETGYDERLRILVTGQPQDAVNYVRTNLGKMKIDATTKTWSAGQ